MSGPRPELARYLDARFPACSVEPMAGDASTREFFRLRLADGGSRVVMDYGRPFQTETDDVVLSRVFQEAALPAARILEASPEPGCLVLEDLGQSTLEEVLQQAGGRSPEEWYREAVDLAVAVAVRGTAVLVRSERSAGPALDRERFRFEMDFFLQHYVGGVRGIAAAPPDLVRQLHALADLAADSPRRVLCHRDFHSRNLIVRNNGSLAMVDIQDARWGPDTYDLASLLRDAYVDIEEDLVERMIERYRARLAQPPDPETFRCRFDRVAAQRMIKALGTFGYQFVTLGNRRYLAAVPRTVRRLDRLLPQRPETVELHRTLADASLLPR